MKPAYMAGFFVSGVVNLVVSIKVMRLAVNEQEAGSIPVPPANFNAAERDACTLDFDSGKAGSNPAAAARKKPAVSFGLETPCPCDRSEFDSRQRRILQ